MLSVRWAAAIALLTANCLPSLPAAEPSLRNLNVRGLQIGGTTSITIEGDDLTKSPNLLLAFPAKTTLKPGATEKQATFDITLGDDVPAGYHHLRVVTEGGVSLPMVIGVDRLPQRLLSTSVETLPAALHGAVGGSGTVEAKFVGKAGQKVLVEIEAQRLASKLRPIIHLLSPKRLQLAWAWATPTRFGDARLEAVLPEDGVYTVAIHDAEYAAPAPSFFRLKLGQWSYVDQVFPSVVGKGQAASIELLGQVATPRFNLPAQPKSSIVPIALPKGELFSGPRPFVEVSSHLEVMEQDMPGKLQTLPTGAVAVNGRLLRPFDEDRYQVAVMPGTKIKLEVFAERYGSPLDAALIVRNEKGDQLARGEDSPGSLDPVLEYTVPDKVTAIVVGVVDVLGRGGPRGVYRLAIHPTTPPAPEFTLSTTVQRTSLAVGGRAVLPVLIDRGGYQGKIELAVNGLPAGVRLEGASIADGADGTLLTLQRAEASFVPTIVTWHGRGSAGDEKVVRIKGHPLDRLQPWMATEFALATSSFKATDFQIDWDKLPTEAGIVPGMKLKLPIKTTRSNPKTAVKLTLMTSQNPPLANNQPDPNKTIRQEKPMELGEKAATGDITALIPVDLSAPMYDIAIQAELLTLDKKSLIATAHTPVRRMAVRLPLVVQLDGPNRLEATVDPKKGTTVGLKGKVERREGLKGDVAIALSGLPAGAKADAVTVKGDATAFAVSIVLPPNVVPGEIKGLKLSASAVADAAQPAQRVKSREVELTLVIKAAAK